MRGAAADHTRAPSRSWRPYWVALALGVVLALPIPVAGQDAPPPRGVNALKAKLAEARKGSQTDASKADMQAPQGMPAADLARFYQSRAQAAEAIGRDVQAAQDYRLASEQARKAGLPLWNFLQPLLTAEIMASNFPAAKAVAEEQLKHAQPGPGQRFGPLSTLSLIHLRMGDVRQSESYVAEVERLLKETEEWRGESRRWLPGFRSIFAMTRGRHLAATGSLREAEAAFRLSLKEHDEVLRNLNNPGTQSGYELRLYFLADTLAKQGRLVEAEIELRRAIDRQIARGVQTSLVISRAVGALSDILAEQGRFAEAEALLREAESTLAAILGTDSRSGAMAIERLRIAKILALRGKPRRAGEIFARIIEERGGDPIEVLASGLGQFFDPILLSALARSRQGAAAESLTRALLDQRERAMGAKAYATAEIRGFLGSVLWLQGKRDEALAAFRAAVPILLEQGARGEDQIAKGLRLQAILESYLAVLFELRDSPSLKGMDIAAETFQLAEAARGRSVQRAIAGAAARLAAGNPALSETVRQEQDLERRIVGLHEMLMESSLLPVSQQVAGTQEGLRNEIAKATAGRAALTKEIAKRFPEYAELIDPKPVALAAARALLKPDEALVTFLVGVEQSYVWAIPAQGDALVAVVKLGAGEVADTVAALRRALDPQAAETTADILAFDVALAHRLYTAFLEPVAPAWSKAKNLVVVQHGALGQIPLSLLVTAKPAVLKPAVIAFEEYRSVAWFARKVAVTQVPSVATFSSLRRLAAGRPDRLPLIAFGDPVFAADQAATADAGQVRVRGHRLALRTAPRTAALDSADLAKLPRLPDTADEIEAIAAVLGADPSRDVFLGPRATEDNVMRTDLSNRRIVMFATHGLVPGDLDGLAQPALALSSPKVVGGSGDGLLTLDKVLSLKLDADWVVLSACNTASASGGEGAGVEDLSGLARAFFYAGARSLLVSNWPVESSSATTITTGLFKRLATDPKLSRAEALRQSMQEAIDKGVYRDGSGKPAYAYAHPIFWAPFSAVGDGWSAGTSP